MLKNKKNISAIVTDVQNYGLFLELDNGEKAFLPKENMLVSKKKKLVDLFTLGFVLNVNVLNKKKEYYIVTQKEIKEVIKEELKTENKKEEVKVKTKNNNSKKEKVVKKKLVEQKNKIIEEKEEKQKNLTLNDLKKLKSVGNLKIKLKKEIKKQNNFESEEKESVVFLDVPENFVENIEENFKLRSKQFEKLIDRVKTQRWLDEN